MLGENIIKNCKILSVILKTKLKRTKNWGNQYCYDFEGNYLFLLNEIHKTNLICFSPKSLNELKILKMFRNHKAYRITKIMEHVKLRE